MSDFKSRDVSNNKNDPLPKAGPDSGQELFRRLSRACDGFPYDAVVSACGNLLVNAVRQHCKSQREAELAMDELMLKLKHVLLDQHYHTNGGRKNIFPFTQHLIQEELVRFKKR